MKLGGTFPSILRSHKNVNLALGSRRHNLNSDTIDRYITIREFFLQQARHYHGDDCTRTRIVIASSFQQKFSNVGHFRHSYSLNYKSSAFPVRLFHSNSLRKQEYHGAKDTLGKDPPIKKSVSSPIQQKVEENGDIKNDNVHIPPNYENYSRFFRRLAMSLPPMHRPTRDDFLNLTTNVWQRLRVHFKWFTIKSFRKFDADEVSAFLTWFLMSQTLWILIGTTTFFGAVFATANSLRLQEHVARIISDYLTAETGITIVFESAVVPKWKDSRLSFKNVYISRQPTSGSIPNISRDFTAGHHAASKYDPGNHPAYHGLAEDDEFPDHRPPEDNNYALFDLNVDSIDVTLSLRRWLDGKGLVKDAVVKGVRGVLDRRFIHYDPDKQLDPASFRHQAAPGDFELDSLELEDVLITVHQPNSFRPYTASIFRADIKTFRKQWMFYDFLSAENVVGQFDNCLFSLHKPQSIGRTTEQLLKDEKWSRMARFRIDGVNIDHLRAGASSEGPISWITSGKVDAVFDVKFPLETDETAIDLILGEIADAITTATSAQAAALVERIPGQKVLAKPAIRSPEDESKNTEIDRPQVMTIEMDLRFRDVKAAVPLFTKELSYVNNALIRPIVAFINANRILIPIHCRVTKDISEFDGAWTMWEAGLMDDIALKIYEALAYHVTQVNFNRRVKAVGLWSLQMAASAMLSTAKAMLDPMSNYLKELSDSLEINPSVILKNF